MSKDGQGTKCRRNIAENLNCLSRAHERYRETDDRRTGDSKQRTFAKNLQLNVSWRHTQWGRVYYVHNQAFFQKITVSDRGTKHIFPDNLAQTPSTVPEIFD